MESRDWEANKDPRELEDEVEAQREEIDQTVAALLDSFVPERMVEQAVDYIRRGGGELSHSLVEAVRANPVATALTATGLSWMLFGQSRRAASPQLPEEELPSRASYGVDPDYDSHSGEGHRALGAGGPGAHRRERYGRAVGGRLMQEQPLAVGIMGIALGALIGASLPRSRQEDELLGDYGERLRRQASRAMDKASVKVEDIGRHVSEGSGVRH